MHRRRTIDVSILLLLCCQCISECLAEAPSNACRPSTTFPYYQRDHSKPLPYNLRGGSTLSATRKRRRSNKAELPMLIKVHKLTIQLHHNASHQIHQFHSHLDQQWHDLLSNLHSIRIQLPIPKQLLLPFKKRSSKLDDVCTSFSSVHSNSKIDTSALLTAIRSHLTLMKSSGSSLKLVAKDLESNLSKVEKLYKAHPAKCRHLSSLLEYERRCNIHDGSILKDPSAAMGLLWIRRSLSFQCDLFASLMISGTNGIHPNVAAMAAYHRHLAPYHGWALSKLFGASMSRMPEREAFIAKFSGCDVGELDEDMDREVVRKLRILTDCWGPMLDCWRGEFERLGLEDTRRV